jgi:hypothetical protein
LDAISGTEVAWSLFEVTLPWYYPKMINEEMADIFEKMSRVLAFK